MCCYARLTTFDALGFSATWLLPDKAAEKTVALIVAFAALAYFSVREMIQMRHERSLELAKPEDPFADEPEGTLTFYALLIPRYALLAAVYAFFAPVFFGLLVVKPHGKRFESGEAFDDWLEKAFLAPILHDPLTFLGLSRRGGRLLEHHRRPHAQLHLGRPRARGRAGLSHGHRPRRHDVGPPLAQPVRSCGSSTSGSRRS